MKTVVFVHSYCLQGAEWDKRVRLTAMAAEAMRTGVRIMKETGALGIIVSTAYGTWQDEFRLQKEFALSEGIGANQVHVLAEIKNSYDEAVGAIKMARSYKAHKLVVIAEKWHAGRSQKAFQAICPNDLELEVVRFKTPMFEITYEPSMIKSLRSSTLSTWVIWNKLLEFVPSFIFRAMSKKADQ